MAVDNNLPFEVGFEKAKAEILAAVSQIGQRYRMPTSILNIILSNLALEAKINTYETILGAYDISTPEELKKVLDPDDNTPTVVD